MVLFEDSDEARRADEVAEARRFRGLIRDGRESPVIGPLDRDYFADLRRKLQLRASEA